MRVIGAGWSPRGLHGARLSGAGRPAVLYKRTPSFIKGHRDVTVSVAALGPKRQLSACFEPCAIAGVTGLADAFLSTVPTLLSPALCT